MSDWIKTRRTQFRPHCVVAYDCWEKLLTLEQKRQHQLDLFTAIKQPPASRPARTAREAERQKANAPKRNRKILSLTGQKRLKKVCELAGMSAEKQRIWKPEKLKYDYFRLGFITLNLSSDEHGLSDREYKSMLIDPFLDWLTKTIRVGMYVIRHELKQSGVIHSHLIIDRYIHYSEIRRKWNELQRKAGVLQLYQNKFKVMRYSEYERYRMRQGASDKMKIRKAYARGVATGWSDPNSTDVKQVASIKAISEYISKYVSKNDKAKKGNEAAASTTEKRELEIAHWSASKNLLAANYFNVIDGVEEEINAEKFAKKIKHIQRGANCINIYILPIYQALKTGSKWLIENFMLWKDSVRQGNKGLITKYLDKEMTEIQPIQSLPIAPKQPKELPAIQLNFNYNPFKLDYDEENVF